MVVRGEIVVPFWLKPGEAPVTLREGRNSGRIKMSDCLSEY